MEVQVLSFYYCLLFLALFFISKLLILRGKNLPPSGPLCLPVIGHLYLFKKPLYRTLARISGSYGPIIILRFGSRRVLVVSSPSVAEECLTTNDIIFANRPRLLVGKYLGYDYTIIPWAPYGDHWRNLRRITTVEIFSSTRLQMFSNVRISEVHSLLRRLAADDTGESFKTVDMKSMFFELTLNFMMMMIAGKRYYGNNVSDLEKAKRFREIVKESFVVGGVSNVGDFLPALRWVGLFKDLEKKLVNLQGKRTGFMQELIEEHRMVGTHQTQSKEEKKTKTMLDVLLSLQEAEPDYYTDEIIIGIILTLLSAGTDSASGTMEWTMTLLLNHPKVLKKAQAEIDSTIGQGRLINESDLTNLPYLFCIINETLRMYPSGPLLAPHESSEECIVGGYTIPRGTMLLVNVWAIQNDPKLWVEPREFRPERMEGVGGGSDGFKLMPFGSGRRGCPGEALGMRMVGLALGLLIQCFEWKRIGQEMVDTEEGTIGLSLSKGKPLEASCRPRSTMLGLLSQI
ncbi:cytochrome P450 81Q32-like [Telopea speciosissima]|uniref:cytochrome P450 81Q32-like n=1 Tax=Telopea speciosissima TaxID=54955 RepID=UPI001CC3E9C5|nr:cytochrome P450 81Q32-like [Telopea speciosissima]